MLSARTKKTVILAAVLLALITAVQVWIISAGTGAHYWKAQTNFYSQLAAGFLHGRLGLMTAPSAQLLALPDPYDPVANAAYRLHDAVLFNGRYYIYWGPVPALFITAGCWILGVFNPSFGDQFPAFVFLVGTMILTTILILQIQSRLFATQRLSTAALAVLSVGLGTPILFVARRLAIYECAILAGQFFLIGGILAAWIGLTSTRPRPLLMAVAGVAWALACGSRVSLPPAVAVVAALTAWQICRKTGNDRRRRVLGLLGLMAPLLAGAALFAWYNYARFGSMSEFGMTYQLAFAPQHGPAAEGFISWRNVAPTLSSYLFTPPAQARTYPFYFAVEGRPWLAHVFHLHRGFRSEPIVGLFWTQPFLLFVPLALLGLARRRPTDQGAMPIAWLIWSLVAGGVLGFAPVLAMNGSTMRPLLDAVPCLTILAAVGLWQTLEFLTERRWMAHELNAAVRVVVLYQVVMAWLLTVSNSPSLYESTRFIFAGVKW